MIALMKPRGCRFCVPAAKRENPRVALGRLLIWITRSECLVDADAELPPVDYLEVSFTRIAERAVRTVKKSLTSSVCSGRRLMHQI